MAFLAKFQSNNYVDFSILMIQIISCALHMVKWSTWCDHPLCMQESSKQISPFTEQYSVVIAGPVMLQGYCVEYPWDKLYFRAVVPNIASITTSEK